MTDILKNWENDFMEMFGHSISHEATHNLLKAIRELLAAQSKQSRREAIDEVVRVVEGLKPDVNAMKHDLQCKCDFERMDILLEVIQILKELL